MERFKSWATQLIELVIPNTITSNNIPVYFQNQPQLQSVMGDQRVRICAIEVYNSSFMTQSPLTSGNPVAAPADINNGVLTINSAGKLRYQNLPLSTLCRTWVDAGTTNSGHVYSLFEFDDLWEVNWTQTYITLILAPFVVVPFSYLLNVHYEYLPISGGL